jgi:hypothetical protein
LLQNTLFANLPAKTGFKNEAGVTNKGFLKKIAALNSI